MTTREVVFDMPRAGRALAGRRPGLVPPVARRWVQPESTCPMNRQTGPAGRVQPAGAGA